jgi:hypothetical protein
VFIKTDKFLAFCEVDNLANVVLNLKADIEWKKMTNHPKGVDGLSI